MIIFVAWKKQMEHTNLLGDLLVGTFLVELFYYLTLPMKISFLNLLNFSIARPSFAL